MQGGLEGIQYRFFSKINAIVIVRLGVHVECSQPVAFASVVIAYNDTEVPGDHPAKITAVLRTLSRWPTNWPLRLTLLTPNMELQQEVCEALRYEGPWAPLESPPALEYFVAIPANVKPGMPMQCKTEQGLFEIQVPHNVTPGETIKIKVPNDKPVSLLDILQLPECAVTLSSLKPVITAQLTSAAMWVDSEKWDLVTGGAAGAAGSTTVLQSTLEDLNTNFLMISISLAHRIHSNCPHINDVFKMYDAAEQQHSNDNLV